MIMCWGQPLIVIASDSVDLSLCLLRTLIPCYIMFITDLSAMHLMCQATCWASGSMLLTCTMYSSRRHLEKLERRNE